METESGDGGSEVSDGGLNAPKSKPDAATPKAPATSIGTGGTNGGQGGALATSGTGTGGLPAAGAMGGMLMGFGGMSGTPDPPLVNVPDAGAPDMLKPIVPTPSNWSGGRAVVGIGLGGRRVISRDGTSWPVDIQDEKTNAETNLAFFDGTFGKDILVLVGGGCINSVCTSRITTWNGNTGPGAWTNQVVPAGAGKLTGIAYGDGSFVAVGTGQAALTSTDGKVWTLTPADGLKGARKLAFGMLGAARRFVVVGDNGLRGQSTDGKIWNDLVSGFPGAEGDINLSAVVVAQGVAVVGGSQGRRLRTLDGRIWIDPAAGGGTITSLVAGDGKIVAFDDRGTAFTSTTQGERWTPTPLINGPSTAIESGLMGPSRLFVGFTAQSASGPSIRTSTDGVSWQASLRGTADQNTLNRFVFGGP